MPTFDPKNFRPEAGGKEYQVTYNLSTLQRSFESWLANPSPVSERLVDQALISSGRKPMFGSLGNQSPQMPAGRGPQFRSATGQFMGRATGYRGEPMTSSQYGRAGFPSYAQTPRPWEVTASSRSFGMQLPPDMTRLWKHMDAMMSSMVSEERRVRYLLEPRPGGGSLSAISYGAAGVSRPSHTAFSPALAQFYARRAAFATGGGGGGGLPPPPLGGGGGAPGGGGGGGSFAGGLLGGAFGRNGVWGAIAGEGAMLAARWPLHLGHAAESLVKASSPFTDWRVQLANMTRLRASMEQSGGVGREMLERSLLPYPGGGQPAWMRNLGVTQTGFTDILGKMQGGVPHEDPLELVRRLRSVRLGAGFAMAPEGSAENLAMMGQKFGISVGHGAAALPEAAAQLLAQGRAAGADVSDVLSSIKEATEALVKTGVKLDLSGTSGWMDFMRKMIASGGTPAAQAGIEGGRALVGAAGVAGHPFQNAATGMVFSQLANQTDWTNNADVKRRTGRTIDEIMGGKNQGDIMALKLLQENPRSFMAIQAAAHLMQGSPNVIEQYSGVINKMPGRGATGDWIKNSLMGVMTGGDIWQGAAARAAAGAVLPPHIRDAVAPGKGTIPGDVYGAQTDAFTLLFRGMRTDFDELTTHIGWVTKALDAMGSGINSLLGRGSGGSSIAPKGGSGTGGVSTDGSYLPMSGSGGFSGTPNIHGPRGGRFGGMSPSSLGRGLSGAAQTGSSILSLAQMKQYAIDAGFSGEQATTMAAIAMAESGGNPNAVGDRSIGGSFGLTQINRKAHGDIALSAKGDPRRAMELAYKISNQGTNFTPWSVFKNQSYRKYMNEAQNASSERSPFPPGMKFNSRGQAYANSFGPGERATNDQSYQYIKTHPDWASRPGSDMNVIWGTGDQAPSDGGGGGQGGIELHGAFDVLGRIVRETAEHLHELGHGARSARSALGGSAGPNAATSPSSTPQSAAYP